MSLMLNRGSELLRIDPKDPNKLEYSTDSGRNWYNRYSGSSSQGTFQDLTENGSEILGIRTQGLFYSTDNGRNWSKR
jgi:hypothetical protein